MNSPKVECEIGFHAVFLILILNGSGMPRAAAQSAQARLSASCSAWTASAVAPGVRVWEVMSRRRGPRGGRPPLEVVHVDYPLERAVILSDGETFSVDETWLKRESSQESRRLSMPDGRLSRDAERERALVEAALAESRGQVSGTARAASKLGIPRQTLESKIRSLGIDKHRFRHG